MRLAFRRSQNRAIGRKIRGRESAKSFGPGFVSDADLGRIGRYWSSIGTFDFVQTLNIADGLVFIPVTSPLRSGQESGIIGLDYVR